MWNRHYNLEAIIDYLLFLLSLFSVYTKYIYIPMPVDIIAKYVKSFQKLLFRLTDIPLSNNL